MASPSTFYLNDLLENTGTPLLPQRKFLHIKTDAGLLSSHSPLFPYLHAVIFPLPLFTPRM